MADHAAPGLGSVIDRARECTDAALVAASMPSHLRKVTSYTTLAAGLTVEVPLSRRVHAGTVLDISIDFDIYKDPKFPVRFSMNKAGRHGDSGLSLLRQRQATPAHSACTWENSFQRQQRSASSRADTPSRFSSWST
jgi:hypothetical protein